LPRLVLVTGLSILAAYHHACQNDIHAPASTRPDAAELTVPSPVRAIAFYLPQFHPIPENDRWWGKGFTEWVNVARARPNFSGHQQPHIPADLGFYDLRVAETRQQQAELAAAAGIHGFCYYYYWFAGKQLLQRPLAEVLHSGEPDFPFCVCWANENWTRSWDGKSGEVLIGQQHSEADHRDFIHSLLPMFRDRRYIRVNGRPLLLIYRIDIIPDVRQAVEIWRNECRQAGLPDPWLVAVQSFGIGDPTPFGFDAAVEFPPHGTDFGWHCNADYRERMLNPDFTGHIIDMQKVVDVSVQRPVPDYPLLRGVMPRWDNTARRQNSSLIFVNSEPTLYQHWLTRMIAYTCRQFSGEERLLFINAWNEWAEGCHLEPDRDSGHAWLEATSRALQSDEPALAAATELQQEALAEPASEPLPQESSGLLLRSVRWLYRRMPLATALKIGLAHWAYAYFPRPFVNTAAYRRWLDCNKAPPPRLMTLLAEALPKAEPKATPETAQGISFAATHTPVVSVIVPVYGKIAYTLQCLRSIQQCRHRTSFEVIVIDDCSTDSTAELLAQVGGVQVIRNEENLGFLRSCNKAAASARGDFLLFLNNDTEVQPGWLDELYNTFSEHPDAGLVGSKLVYPDGSLQEAGGLIWHDGSGTNHGRGDDPGKPEYNFLRDVDYCSGASVMVPRALFERLGGFDSALAPAYYEDTDLAFALRQAGYRVIYQPFSRVVHHEGITSGTDVSRGIKAYQEINRHKFLAKWQQVLALYGSSKDESWLQRERRVERRALLVDVITPKPDKDSGSIDTLQYIHMLQALGYKVVFCPHDLLHAGRYTEVLQRLGVECLYQPYTTTLRAHLMQYGRHYDLVILERAHVAVQHIDEVRRHCGKALVLFNTVDLHFVREQRQAEIEQSAELAERALLTKAQEYAVMRQSDATIVISETERELLQREWPALRVAAIPYIRPVQGCANPFARRHDLLFVGGFLFDPNIDAVNWFLEEIWPLIRQALPDVHLLLVGSGMPPELVKGWQRPGVEVLGYVENLKPVIDRCRLSIAPLRYGAGIKGKIGTSLSHGVPCVATPLAAEGMGLTDRDNVMLGSDAEAFAAAVIELYCDEVLWNRLSQKGLELFEQQYSFARGMERLGRLLDEVTAARQQ